MDRLVLVLLTVTVGFNVISSDNLVHNANTTVADKMAKKIRVVCLLTVAKHDGRDQAVKETWGRRCNRLGFLSEIRFREQTPGQRGKYQLRAAYERYGREADWFVILTGGYLLVENLRLMLSEYNPYDNIYFMPRIEWEGLKFVMSKNALRDLVTRDQFGSSSCHFSEIGDISSSCLDSINFHHMDSRDFLRRERIVPENPYNYQQKQMIDYSDFAVSFEDVNPHLMYVIDYLVYQLRPFGINFGTKIPKSQSHVNRLIQRRKQQIYANKKPKLGKDNIKLMQKIVNLNQSTALNKVKLINYEGRTQHKKIHFNI